MIFRFSSSSSNRCSTSPPTDERRGLTLIEMLVGMAITLIMMAAVVNLFANISAGVRNRQGKMELNAATRLARTRLYNDLANVTVFQRSEVGCCELNDDSNGYFEYVEGRRSDEDPSSLVTQANIGTANGIDPATSLVPSSNDILDSEGQPLDPTQLTDGRALGDYDDILAFTARNEVSLYRGRGRGLKPGGDPTDFRDWIDVPMESPLAEVVWFCVENPLNAPPLEPGMRRVYRRVLLIAPWFGVATNVATDTTGADPSLDLTGLTYAERLRSLREFQANYDISARIEHNRIVPNSLADLSRREWRYAHLPDNRVASPDVSKFPHPFPYNMLNGDPDQFSRNPALSPRAGDVTSSLKPLGTENEGFAVIGDERYGEDLILDNVLAFDVQVFDPGAPNYTYQGSTIPASAAVINNQENAFFQAVRNNASILGYGGYVDLGWNNGLSTGTLPVYAPAVNAPPTLFQQERQIGWHPGLPPDVRRGTPAVYDTWTSYYEHDQIDQDDRDNDQNSRTGVDEGTNGLDDFAYYDDDNDQNTPPFYEQRYGPDDSNERETSAPYPSPLEGLKVRLRVYEPGTRQIRETTIVRKIAK